MFAHGEEVLENCFFIGDVGYHEEYLCFSIVVRMNMRYGRELPGYPFNMRALCTRGIIVLQRKLYARWLRRFSMHAPMDYNFVGARANDAIRDLLLSDAPCMIARFGSGELETTLRHLDISLPGSVFVKSVRLLLGQSGPFWWDNSIRAGITWLAGLFPPTNETMDRFGERILQDSKEIDLLAGWLAGEKRLNLRCFPHAKCIPLVDLEPFLFLNPWTHILAKKKVLLVHPFETTIRHQYAKREHLFKDSCFLPSFTLKTYKTVQSLAGNHTRFSTWFEALEFMCSEISGIDFDIAIIGAGAYGMSIAAHIKRMGKKAIHMGGSTQLLFGIKGGRWDNIPAYSQNLYNEYWIRPLSEDCPSQFKTVEAGCYW